MEPYEGREPYIFASYARKDKERVEPYLDALSGAGYRVWYDKGIHAGADWLDTLLDKVENCAVFCPLFSEAFKNSRYCLFETAWAYQKTDKTIVSLYLDNLEKDNLGRLYQHLRKFQELQLHNLPPAQFAERVEREQAFAPCKVPEWHTVGEIQWRLSADGVLSIARNEALPWALGAIPSYQHNPVHGGSTAPWMPYREKILSVEIADNIKAIGDYAFYACKILTKVLIGDSVTAIGDNAFARCESLTDVRIPDSMTQIGDWAFGCCQSLTDVRIPDSVTQIGDYAFYDCKILTKVFIGNNVTAIGDSTFARCKQLTDVRIPDSVTQIGKSAFLGCENLTDVHIPDSMTQIDVLAFADCKSLTNVRIPDSVSEIGKNAFWGCENLKYVEIPAGAKMSEGTFYYRTLVTRRDKPTTA